MTSVDSNFNFLCGRPHGAWPLPLSTCIHLSLTPLPLHVDIINGWPPNVLTQGQMNNCIGINPGEVRGRNPKILGWGVVGVAKYYYIL